MAGPRKGTKFRLSGPGLTPQQLVEIRERAKQDFWSAPPYDKEVVAQNKSFRLKIEKLRRKIND
jgi:hypothetical protein